MTTELNLRGLALERPRADRPQPQRSFPWLSRYAMPGAVLLGFVGLLGWSAREQLLPRRSVTVVPVVVTRAEVRTEGTALFQAAGWVEPRPTAFSVAALTDGVVAELLVVEGQAVTAGEPIARLVDQDAKMALREAVAERALREAEVRSAQAELKAAHLRVENPVHLNSALAEAESWLARAETELAKLPFLRQSAQARLNYATTNLRGKQTAGDAVSHRVLQEAESEQAAMQSELDELKQRRPQLQREVEALQRKQAALALQRKLLIEESRQFEDAQAQVAAAGARREQAQIAVDRATLNLERTLVRSALSGRVMQLVAHPGTRVQGAHSTASSGSSTVVTLYDPTRLQIRADVRLEDIPLVQAGQSVEIKTAVSKETLHGTVLTMTSAANVQKNTLEVKVAIDAPPVTLRPEMLVTTTFLAPPTIGEREKSSELERLLVPKELVEGQGSASTIWIVDALGQARARRIRVGRAITSELVEVLDGLSPTDKLIAGERQGLQDGERVQISGEDTRLGIRTSTE